MKTILYTGKCLMLAVLTLAMSSNLAFGKLTEDRPASQAPTNVNSVLLMDQEGLSCVARVTKNNGLLPRRFGRIYNANTNAGERNEEQQRTMPNCDEAQLQTISVAAQMIDNKNQTAGVPAAVAMAGSCLLGAAVGAVGVWGAMKSPSVSFTNSDAIGHAGIVGGALGSIPPFFISGSALPARGAAWILAAGGALGAVCAVATGGITFAIMYFDDAVKTEDNVSTHP